MKFDVTSYAVSWFKDRYNEETLTIKPPYQRRPVWGLRQKVKLIESVRSQGQARALKSAVQVSKRLKLANERNFMQS